MPTTMVGLLFPLALGGMELVQGGRMGSGNGWIKKGGTGDRPERDRPFRRDAP